MKRFGASVSRLFGPCAARVFGRRVPFSQVAFAVWKCKRLGRLCFRIRHPPEVSACESMPLLRRHETGGTLALLRLVPSFPAFRQTKPYGRFQRVRCSTGASLSVSQCRLAKGSLTRAILSSDSQ